MEKHLWESGSAGKIKQTQPSNSLFWSNLFVFQRERCLSPFLLPSTQSKLHKDKCCGGWRGRIHLFCSKEEILTSGAFWFVFLKLFSVLILLCSPLLLFPIPSSYTFSLSYLAF
jgi:hypothetical protein